LYVVTRDVNANRARSVQTISKKTRVATLPKVAPFPPLPLISLNSTNRSVFVIETRCVFVEVGTEFLNIILMKDSRHSPHEPQTVESESFRKADRPRILNCRSVLFKTQPNNNHVRAQRTAVQK
jgi:hypothetical protein